MATMPRWSSVAAPALSSTANQSSQVLPVRRATASVLTPAASLMLLRAGFFGAGGAAGAGALALAGAAGFVAAAGLPGVTTLAAAAVFGGGASFTRAVTLSGA